VRPARDDDAFFVTDAPRRLPEENLSALERNLADNGYLIEATHRGLWRIDLDETRFMALCEAYRLPTPLKVPADDTLLGAYALVRLLLAHPAPWADQPRAPLRALLKRYDRREPFLTCVKRQTEACAVRLRKGGALPSAAAGILQTWLTEQMKEEEA
jgi:hypothetical protein